MASSPFTTPPESFHARFDPQLFRVLLLRALGSPCLPFRALAGVAVHSIPVAATCANSGVLGRGGFAVESAVARVC